MTEQVIRIWTDAFMAEDWEKISEIYADMMSMMQGFGIMPS